MFRVLIKNIFVLKPLNVFLKAGSFNVLYVRVFKKKKALSFQFFVIPFCRCHCSIGKRNSTFLLKICDFYMQIKESSDLIYYAGVVMSTIRFPSNQQNKLFYRFVCLAS